MAGEGGAMNSIRSQKKASPLEFQQKIREEELGVSERGAAAHETAVTGGDRANGAPRAYDPAVPKFTLY